METLKRLTLIATLTGLVSGSWLGVVERPAVSDPPADTVVGVGTPASIDRQGSGDVQAFGRPAAAVTFDAATNAGDSVASALSAVGDEAVPQAAPTRRGGGIGIALKR